MRNTRAALFLAAATLVLGLLAFTAFWLEPRTLTVRAFAIDAPSWRAEPLRIAFLSDIHVDSVHMPPQRVGEIAARVRELSPDIVILGGDYVGGHLQRSGPPGAARSRRSPAEVSLDERGLRALGSFSAPLGVYAVMGNHDCWWDCTRVREILSEAGVILLENRSVEVLHPPPRADCTTVRIPEPQKAKEPAACRTSVRQTAGSFWLAGVADGQTQRPDFARTLAPIPDGAAFLTIVHNPGLFDWPADTAPIQLSGHTHAGQVRLPLIGAPVRMSRYTEETADGFMIRNGRILIVTRGVGEVGLPLRFGAPPEVLLLDIRYAPKGPRAFPGSRSEASRRRQARMTQ